LAQVQTRIS